MDAEQRRAEEATLLTVIAENLPRLQNLWQRVDGHWGREDGLYRFYHQSLKVYSLQKYTQEIVEILGSLAPHLPLSSWFLEIVTQGIGREFTVEVNQHWTESTRPIVEAFLHAHYFLDMICRYGKQLVQPPDAIPSGWAAVLELYGLR